MFSEETSARICGFVTSLSSSSSGGDQMTHVMLIPAMYILAHTSTATTNTRVCCYTHSWGVTQCIYHPLISECAFRQLVGCYTCTPSTGVCCYTAKGLLHMFTWHRCQPCSANTPPIERGFSDDSVRTHFAIQPPVQNCFVTALLLFWTPATLVGGSARKLANQPDRGEIVF